MDLVLVVGGYDKLATKLAETGQFKEVLTVNSTSGLRDLIGTRLRGARKTELVFLFADTMDVDTPQTLDTLCRKLSEGGWRLIIIDKGRGGRALVELNAGIGLLAGNLTLNSVLGAISGLPGMTMLTPDANGYDELDRDDENAAAQPAGWDDWSAPDQQPTTTTTAEAKPRRDRAKKPTGLAGGNTATPKPDQPAAPAPNMGWEEPAEDQPTAGWQQPASEQPAGGSGANSWEQPTGGWTEPVDDSWGPPVGAGADPAGASAATAGGLAALGGADHGWEMDSNPAGAPTYAAPTMRRDRMSVRDEMRNQRGRLIAVTAPKGGTGKSTLSINLAVYLGLRLQNTGRRVCLVDANFQQADVGKYLATYRPNIYNLATERSGINQQSISRNLVHRRDFNLHALLGPTTPIEASPNYMNGDLYSAVTDTMRDMFDYIIVDTPVAELYHDIFDNFVLPKSDYLLVAVTPNMPTLLNADLWLQAIVGDRHSGGRGYDANKIGIVLNQAEDGIDCSEDDVQNELSRWPYVGSVPLTKEWKRAAQHGEVVADKNYAQLNKAFEHVLYAATGDAALKDGIVPTTKSSKKRRFWLF